MPKTVIIALLFLHSGICLQDAVNNVEYSEKIEQNPTAQTPNVKSESDAPASNTAEDLGINVVLPQTSNKKAAATVGLSPEQIDALADKILQIHGVEPQVESPQNFARVQRLRNVVSNVENKLENKLKEVAEQANDEVVKNSDSSQEADETGKEPAIDKDAKESNSQSNVNDENNHDTTEQEVVLKEAQDQQDGIKDDTGIETEAVAESKQEQEQEAAKENETVGATLANTEQDSENLKFSDDDKTLQEQDFEINKEETVNNKLTEETIQEGIETKEADEEAEEEKINKEETVENKITEEEATQEDIEPEEEDEINKEEAVENKLTEEEAIHEDIETEESDANAASDTVTDLEEDLDQSDSEKEQTTDKDDEIREEDRNEENTKKDTEEESSDLKGAEEETEENIDDPVITPVLTLEEIQLNTENGTNEEPTNNVDQDTPNLDTISPTPSLKDDEIVKTRDTASLEEEEEEEEIDETELETCNTEVSDCDKGGKGHLYTEESNIVEEELEEDLEDQTKKGYFSKILKFVYDRF